MTERVIAKDGDITVSMLQPVVEVRTEGITMPGEIGPPGLDGAPGLPAKFGRAVLGTPPHDLIDGSSWTVDDWVDDTVLIGAQLPIDISAGGMTIEENELYRVEVQFRITGDAGLDASRIKAGVTIDGVGFPLVTARAHPTDDIYVSAATTMQLADADVVSGFLHIAGGERASHPVSEALLVVHTIGAQGTQGEQGDPGDLSLGGIVSGNMDVQGSVEADAVTVAGLNVPPVLHGTAPPPEPAGDYPEGTVYLRTEA